MSTEHIPLWQEYVAAVEAEGRQAVAEVEARLARVQEELRQRPERVVEKYINQEDVQAAKDEASRAFRSREMAWRELSAVGILHTELEREKCRCGKSRRLCPEAAIVESVRGLPAWEARQAAEHRAGRPHYLPDGHPALIDHRWSGVEPEEWAPDAT